MPFALVIIGLIMIVTGAKGTHSALGRQMVKDFSGENNFFYWFAAIGSVGSLGAIPEFRQFSRVFMALILIAMVIRNGGVFDQIIKAIKSGPVAPPRSQTASPGGGLKLPGMGGVPETDYKIIDTPALQVGIRPGSPADNFRAFIGGISKFFNPFG